MADTKISALIAQTLLAFTDIVPVVVNPGSSPATKKVTVADLLGAGTLYSIIPAAGFALGTGTAAQDAFPSDQNVFTLEANTTYFFRGRYIISKSGTTGTVGLSFSLTGLVANVIRYVARTLNVAVNSVGTAINMAWVNQTANTVVTATDTTAVIIEFDGILRTGAAGTLTPQITFSASPTAPSMEAGSFLVFLKQDNDTAKTRGAVA